MAVFFRNHVTEPVKPPRMFIIEDILERAIDCEDEFITGACRRLIIANRLGWQKHHDPRDWQLVKEMAESLAEDEVLSDDIRNAVHQVSGE